MDCPDQSPPLPPKPMSCKDIASPNEMASCELSGAPDVPSCPATSVSSEIVVSSDKEKSSEAPENLSTPSPASQSKVTRRVSFALPVKPTEELEPECWPFGRKSTEIEHRLKTEELRHLLPASFRNGKAWIGVPEKRVEHFLMSDLNVDRLMEVSDCFFMLGEENKPPRALSYQQALGREITVTEKMDMHLLGTKGNIFIKPLPRYLLELNFWNEYLECPKDCSYHSKFTSLRKVGQLRNSHRLTKRKPCNHSIVWMRAMGFCFSYVCLIAHESDFEIAKSKKLIPGELKFEDWKYFVSRVLSDSGGGKILKQIDWRFTYGELDLARLNQIFMIRSPFKWLFQGNEYRDLVRGHFFLPPFSISVAVVLGYRFAKIAYTKGKESKVFATVVLIGCLWSVLRFFFFGKGVSPVV